MILLLSQMEFQILFVVFWIVLLIILVGIEFATQDLVSIWFIIGSIGAIICAAFNLSFLEQFFVFLGISIILLFATRPLTKKFMKREIVRTNFDRLVGMTAIVTKDIKKDELGEVKVEGLYWRAYSPVGDEFKEGERVYINAINGTKLVVSKIEEELNNMEF
ncbi:MAG: NfeD family protein [Acholeplasmataceae bacterium]|nr:NfeD family protein [Acholeplasmataceae bacterium]